MRMSVYRILSLVCLLGLVTDLPRVAAQVKKGAVADLYDNIYTDLNAFPCTRLLNSTHQVGCNGPRNPVTGYMRLYETQALLDELLTSSPKDPFAVLVPHSLFNAATVQLFNSVSTLIGVIVYPDSDPNPMVNPAPPSPSNEVSLYGASARIWNPQGSDLINQDISYPIWTLWNQEEIDGLVAKVKGNRDSNYASPRWGVEFRAFMRARQSSLDCISKARCQPVGGFNVWMSLPRLAPPGKPTVWALSSYSAGAFFHDMAIGAEAYLSGHVAMLAAAAVLAGRGELADFPAQIIFMALTGETFSLTGSRKLVSDIATPFQCQQWSDDKQSCSKPVHNQLGFVNMSLDATVGIFEMGQVGRNTTGSLYTHIAPGAASQSSAPLAAAYRQFASDSGTTVTPATVDQLPPSSLHSFLKAKADLPHVLIEDYNSEFANPAFGSQFDTADKVDPQQVCAASNALVRSLYNTALMGQTNVPGAVPASTLSVNCTIVTGLLDCLAGNWNCPLLREFYPKAPLAVRNFVTHYTGVYSPYSMSFNGAFVRSFFQHFSNEQSAQVEIFDVHDPGVEITYTGNGYYAWNVIDASQPIWMESDWDQDLGVRIFLQEPYMFIPLLVFGLLSTFVTGVVTWYVRKLYRAHDKDN